MKKRNLLVTVLGVSALVSAAGFSAMAEEDTIYVQMNIPYSVFYEDLLTGNDTAVDSVSSATSSKWYNADLTAGSYHSSEEESTEGGEIYGVQFPVAATAADLESFTEGAENEDYGYTVLDEEPLYYRTLTVTDGVASFSEIQGNTEVTELTDASLELDTASVWGDYQLNPVGADDVFTSESEDDPLVVYGAIVETADKTYAMRHLENLWRGGEISWSVGILTEEPHGCALNPAHYSDMAGKTVTGVTFYLESGIYHISAGEDGIYLPYKFENTFEVETVLVSAGSAAVTMESFPEDYEPVYTVTDANGEACEGFSCDGTALTFGEDTAFGAYTLTVSDGTGVYSPYEASFELQTEAMPAQYNDDGALVAAEGASDEEFSAYVASISSVAIGEESYSASGRHSVQIILEDGSIDFTSEVFESMASGDTCEFTVTATGYQNTLTFTVTLP